MRFLIEGWESNSDKTLLIGKAETMEDMRRAVADGAVGLGGLQACAGFHEVTITPLDGGVVMSLDDLRERLRQIEANDKRMRVRLAMGEP